MDEFNNRIDAQRAILRTVNSRNWGSEELCGLSDKAISRWMAANRIDPASNIVTLVRDAADKLFFLANKSQEQVSEDYRAKSRDISSIAENIKLEMIK